MEDNQLVYIIKMENDTKKTKIGKSSKYKVNSRLSQLQVSSPDRMFLIGYIEILNHFPGVILEKIVHDIILQNKDIGYRIRGEWFYIENDDLFIDCLSERLNNNINIEYKWVRAKIKKPHKGNNELSRKQKEISPELYEWSKYIDYDKETETFNFIGDTIGEKIVTIERMESKSPELYQKWINAVAPRMDYPNFYIK